MKATHSPATIRAAYRAMGYTGYSPLDDMESIETAIRELDCQQAKMALARRIWTRKQPDQP